MQHLYFNLLPFPLPKSKAKTFSVERIFTCTFNDIFAVYNAISSTLQSPPRLDDCLAEFCFAGSSVCLNPSFRLLSTLIALPFLPVVASAVPMKFNEMFAEQHSRFKIPDSNGAQYIWTIPSSSHD